MSVRNRIKIFLMSEKMTVRAFEISIKAANGYVNGMRQSIGLDKLEAIVQCYPNLSLEWLLIGTGEMYKSNNQSFKLDDISDFVNKQLLESDHKTISALLNVIQFQLEKNELLEKALNAYQSNN